MTIYSPNTQPEPTNGKYPRRHIVLAAVVGILIGFALSIAPKSDASAKRVVVDLPKPIAQDVTDATSVAPAPEVAAEAINNSPEAIPPQSSIVASTPEPNTQPPAVALAPHVIEVQKGDSLSELFQRANLKSNDLDAILTKQKTMKGLPHLQPGQKFVAEVDIEGSLKGFTLGFSKTEALIARREVNDEFSLTMHKKEPVPFTTYTQGVIRSSLFQAAKDAGLNTTMTMDLAKIFDFDIDFALDIRRGDSFKVIYEELFVDGQKVGDGKILAAEFVNQGKKYSAVRYKRADGSFEYYSGEGSTLKKAFIRSPIDFAKVSSPFNLSRMHPVLHMIRAHKGTDYAAGYGTPIKATGDGAIKLAGRQEGYGNVVIIDHGRGYETLYAHMQGFASGIKNGGRVHQGQVIGYVGSTGLATGPHLHYEFHVNGQVKDPVTVALPESLPIGGPERVAFNKQAKGILKQMATFAGAYEASHIALAEEK